jgi:hypothetical protein
MAVDSSRATAMIIVLCSFGCISGLRTMPSMAWQQIHDSPMAEVHPNATQMDAAMAIKPKFIVIPPKFGSLFFR